jgi:hypothetical protein
MSSQVDSKQTNQEQNKLDITQKNEQEIEQDKSQGKKKEDWKKEGEKEKNTSGQNDKDNKDKQKSEGVFSKIGALVNNVIVGAKQAIFPDFKDSGKEAQEEDKKEDKEENKCKKEQKTNEKIGEDLSYKMESMIIDETSKVPMEEKIHYIMYDKNDYTQSEDLKNQEKPENKKEKFLEQKAPSNENLQQEKSEEIKVVPDSQMQDQQLKEHKSSKDVQQSNKQIQSSKDKINLTEKENILEEKSDENKPEPRSIIENLRLNEQISSTDNQQSNEHIQSSKDNISQKQKEQSQSIERPIVTGAEKYLIKTLSGRDSQDYDNTQRSLPTPNLN